MSNTLAVTNVTIRYDASGPPVLSDLTVRLRAGERVALVGLNGSGKTSLLLAIVGLIWHEGRIEVCGRPVTPQNIKQIRQNVGFVFTVPEDQLLFANVIDDVAFGLVRRGVRASEAHKKAQHLLDQLGIGNLARASVHQLSHGQKQRVALAGVLVSSPSLLLLDEPSAALDPPSRRAFARLLKTIDAAMLIATHDLVFARSLCDRYVLLRDGNVAYDGTDVAKVEAFL